jgi:hypothetical protein
MSNRPGSFLGSAGVSQTTVPRLFKNNTRQYQTYQ